MVHDNPTLRQRHKVSSSDAKQCEEVESFTEKADTKEVIEDHHESSSWLDFVLECLLGYILWSVLFSVAPTIWFYPLNELEITGYEAFAVFLLLPVFTGIQKLGLFVKGRSGLTVFRFLTVTSILSYQAPTTLSRLILNSIGSGFAMLWFTGLIWYPDKNERQLMFWSLVIGYILQLVIRMSCTTLTFIWSSEYGNIGLFVLAAVSACVRYFRMGQNECIESSSSDDSLHSTQIRSKRWWIVSLGFGAWLFLVQLLFGEVSVVFRWIVVNAPENHFNPNPYSVFLLAALILGAMYSTSTSINYGLCWLMASCSAALFYYGAHKVAFLSACCLGFCTLAIFPQLVANICRFGSAKTMTLALLSLIILLLASVWTVAYNFVPGGEYTRESNNILLAVTMILIGAGTLCNEEFIEAGKTQRISQRERFIPLSNGRKRIIFSLLFILLLVGSGSMYSRYNGREAKRTENAKGKSDTFSAAIWTVHFGFDNEGWPSFARAAEFLNNTRADVIGILESDSSRPYLGSTDFVQYMEEKLGFYADYGPATRDHTWGAGILSRYPIVNSTHHLLPSPEGELAPAVSAVVDINGVLVTFVIVHMGNDGDDLDRKLQAEELSRILDQCNTPVVFLGYVTSSPGSRDYRQLTVAGRTKDIDEQDYERWCEYIFYRGLIRLGYARISRGKLSDTELQMAKFKLHRSDDVLKDNDVMTINPNDVERKNWFPDVFGDYRDDSFYGPTHYYQMSTPKYFR